MRYQEAALGQLSAEAAETVAHLLIAKWVVMFPLFFCSFLRVLYDVAVVLGIASLMSHSSHTAMQWGIRDVVSKTCM